MLVFSNSQMIGNSSVQRLINIARLEMPFLLVLHVQLVKPWSQLQTVNRKSLSNELEEQAYTIKSKMPSELEE